MAGTIVTAKRAALEGYVTLCTDRPRRVRRNDLHQGCRCAPGTDREHLLAAVKWICRAQDATADEGVAAMYSMVEGWKGSYPETTGYIIPALYDAIGWIQQHDIEVEADGMSVSDLRLRVGRMADWLLRQQLADGAFPGMFVGQLGPARVFNTGQVIFGLLRAGTEQNTAQHIDAAVQAGRWLLSCQDDDGAWRSHELNDTPHTYNTRTAWALARLAEVTNQRPFLDAAIANCQWAIQQQNHNGWFNQNAFTAGAEYALLHTIAYAIRGLLEVGAICGQERFVTAARQAADALHHHWCCHHRMGGAFAEDWSVPVTWRCLSGEAQIAIGWLRLDQLANKQHYRKAAIGLLEQTKAAQFMNEPNADYEGGLSGSFPINGDYERYCLVNWGAKFLIDALILKGATHRAHPTG